MPQVAHHTTRDVLRVPADCSLREAAATERDVMQAVASGAGGDAPAAEWMTQHPVRDLIQVAIEDGSPKGV